MIPKSAHKERIIENFQVFDFTLNAEDMEAIKALDEGKSMFFDHRTLEAAKLLNGIKI